AAAFGAGFGPRLLAIGLGLEQRFRAVLVEHLARFGRALVAGIAGRRGAARIAAARPVGGHLAVFGALLARLAVVDEVERRGAFAHGAALRRRFLPRGRSAQMWIGVLARQLDRLRLGHVAVEIDARFVGE